MLQSNFKKLSSYVFYGYPSAPINIPVSQYSRPTVFFQVNWSVLEFSENKAGLNIPRSSQRRLLDMVASLILELKMEAGY